MPSGGPAAGKRDHGRFMLGPVVEGSGIEIRAVRPDERMRFTVERDGIELVEIAQRAVELAFEDGPEALPIVRTLRFRLSVGQRARLDTQNGARRGACR